MVTKKEINGYFAKAVRMLKAEGYTQKEIVLKAGLAQNAISKILTGQNNCGDETIQKLCKAFDLNPAFFYGESTAFRRADEDDDPDVPVTPAPSNSISAEVAAKNETIAAKDETIASLKRELATKDGMIVVLQKQLEDKDTIIEAKNEQIATLNSRVNELYNQHVSRNGDFAGFPLAVDIGDKQPQKVVQP